MYNVYDQAKPISYNVTLIIKGPMRGDVKKTLVMAQEELDKAIGRYTRHHGPPLNMSEDRNGPTTLEFYSKEKLGIHEIVIKYQQTKGNQKQVENEKTEPVVTAPKEPATPPPPPPEQIQKLMEADVLISPNKWGYYR